MVRSSQRVSIEPDSQLGWWMTPARTAVLVCTAPAIENSERARQAFWFMSSKLDPRMMIFARRESKSVPTVQSDAGALGPCESQVSIRTPRPPGQITSEGCNVPGDSWKPFEGSSAVTRSWTALLVGGGRSWSRDKSRMLVVANTCSWALTRSTSFTSSGCEN